MPTKNTEILDLRLLFAREMSSHWIHALGVGPEQLSKFVLISSRVNWKRDPKGVAGFTTRIMRRLRLEAKDLECFDLRVADLNLTDISIEDFKEVGCQVKSFAKVYWVRGLEADREKLIALLAKLAVNKQFIKRICLTEAELMRVVGVDWFQVRPGYCFAQIERVRFTRSETKQNLEAGEKGLLVYGQCPFVICCQSYSARLDRDLSCEACHHVPQKTRRAWA